MKDIFVQDGAYGANVRTGIEKDNAIYPTLKIRGGTTKNALLSLYL